VKPLISAFYKDLKRQIFVLDTQHRPPKLN
jgi:hypothetical protein